MLTPEHKALAAQSGRFYGYVEARLMAVDIADGLTTSWDPWVGDEYSHYCGWFPEDPDDRKEFESILHEAGRTRYEAHGAKYQEKGMAYIDVLMGRRAPDEPGDRVGLRGGVSA